MNTEITIYSTKIQLEEFKSSMVWKDLQRELVHWRKGFRAELNGLPDKILEGNLTSAASLTFMGELNGRIKAVEYLLNLPNIFLQILEDKSNDPKRA